MTLNTQEESLKDEKSFHLHFATWFSTKRNILMIVSKASFLVINNWTNMAGSAPVARVVTHSGFSVILQITNLAAKLYENLRCIRKALGVVHSAPEHFENEAFTLKTQEIFSVHTTPGKGKFGFVIEGNSGRKLHDYLDENVFESLTKCSRSTLTTKSRCF